MRLDDLFRHRYLLFCVALVCIAGTLSAMIAFRTKFNSHPDEIYHLDAFCYFENHWWYPDIGASGLRYGPFGDARVQNPEIAYWLYGRIGAVIKPFANRIAYELNQQIKRPAFYKKGFRTYFPFIASGDYCRTIPYIYRLQNTFLFLFTLSTLFWVGLRHKWAFVFGIALLCIPQLIYVYSYANTDAWGISFSIFLIIFVLIEPRPFSSWKKTILLSLLVGAVFLSKQSYWLSIVLPGFLIGYRLFQPIHLEKGINDRISVRWMNVVVFGGLLLIIIAPMYIIFPLSQNINPLHGIGQLARFDPTKASIDYQLDHPGVEGYYLKARGVSFIKILIDPIWLKTSLKSFYGYFGYMKTSSPGFAYWIASILLLVNVLITIFIGAKHWTSLPGLSRLALIMSPLIIIMSIGLSVYYSWAVDYQPQGRYIFSALTVLPFLFAGTMEVEGKWVRFIRVFSAIILFGLSIYIIWVYVIMNPVLAY